MHKRLCFLLPDVRRANLVIEQLRQAGISDQHLMIAAKEDAPIDDPPTNIDKTDFYPGLERGLAVGGVLGAIAGLVVLRLTPLGLVLGGAAIPLLAMIGAGVSGFMTALAGASFPNSRLTQFEDAVKRGEILIVVDVPDAEIGRIEALVREAHAKAEFVGVEPHTLVIPLRPLTLNLAAAVYRPPLAHVLDVEIPDARSWALIMVFSLLPWAIGQAQLQIQAVLHGRVEARSFTRTVS